MVSEATDAILAGIISGGLVTVTHPLIKKIADKILKFAGSNFLFQIYVYLLLYLFWFSCLFYLVLRIWG